MSVTGSYDFPTRGESSYVTFEVHVRGASHVRFAWPDHGGASQRARGGRVTLGFADRRSRSFRVRVRACNGRRCGRMRVFRGSFRPGPRRPKPTGDEGEVRPGGGETDEPPPPSSPVPGTPTPPMGPTVPVPPR